MSKEMCQPPLIILSSMPPSQKIVTITETTSVSRTKPYLLPSYTKKISQPSLKITQHGPLKISQPPKKFLNPPPLKISQLPLPKKKSTSLDNCPTPFGTLSTIPKTLKNSRKKISTRHEKISAAPKKISNPSKKISTSPGKILTPHEKTSTPPPPLKFLNRNLKKYVKKYLILKILFSLFS